MANEVLDYAFIEIDASGFENNLYLEFGASEERSKSQFRIILGGWNSERSRIAAYDSNTKRFYDHHIRNHSYNQWKNIRFKYLKT